MGFLLDQSSDPSTQPSDVRVPTNTPLEQVALSKVNIENQQLAQTEAENRQRDTESALGPAPVQNPWYPGAAWRQAGTGLVTSMLLGSNANTNTPMDPSFDGAKWAKDNGLDAYQAAFAGAPNEDVAKQTRSDMAQAIPDSKLIDSAPWYESIPVGMGVSAVKDPIGTAGIGIIGSLTGGFGLGLLGVEGTGVAASLSRLALQSAYSANVGGLISGAYTAGAETYAGQNLNWHDIGVNYGIGALVGGTLHATLTKYGTETIKSLPAPQFDEAGNPISIPGPEMMKPEDSVLYQNLLTRAWLKLPIKGSALQLQLSSLPFIRDQAMKTAEANTQLAGATRGAARPTAATTIGRDDLQAGHNLILKQTAALDTSMADFDEAALNKLSPTARAEAAYRLNTLNGTNIASDDPNLAQLIKQNAGKIFAMITNKDEESNITPIESAAAPVRQYLLKQTQRRLDLTPDEAFGDAGKPTASDALPANTAMFDPLKIYQDQPGFQAMVARNAAKVGMTPEEAANTGFLLKNYLLDRNNTRIPNSSDIIEATSATGLKGAQIKALATAMGDDSWRYQLVDPKARFNAFQQGEAPDLALGEATGFTQNAKLRAALFDPSREAAVAEMRAAGTSEKDIAVANQRWGNEMNLLENIRDRFQGRVWANHDVISDLSRIARASAVTTTLGADMLTQSNSIMTMAGRIGFKPVFAQLAHWLANGDVKDISKENATNMNVNMENGMSAKDHVYASTSQANEGLFQDMTARDIQGQLGGYNGGEQFVKLLADASQTAAQWTQWANRTRWLQDVTHSWALNAGKARLVEIAQDAQARGWDALSNDDKIFATTYGLGPKDLAVMGPEVAKITDHAAKLAYKPSDLTTARKLDYATTRIAYSAIHSLNAGSMPPFMDNPVGRAMFQFTSFAYAMNDQYIIPGLQNPTASFGGSLMGMLAYNMLRIRLTEIANGKLADRDRFGFLSSTLGIRSSQGEQQNAASLFLNAVERMGILGPSYEMGRYGAEALQDINLFPKTGKEEPDIGKFAEHLLGPGMTSLGSAGLAAGFLVNHGYTNLTEKQKNQLYNAAPLHNLFGFQWLKQIESMHQGQYKANVHAQLNSPLLGPTGTPPPNTGFGHIVSKLQSMAK